MLTIDTNSPLLSFDIAEEIEILNYDVELIFHFVPNLTGICLLLKRASRVFQVAKKFIEAQGKTLEKVILSSSPHVNHIIWDKSKRI